MQRHLRTANAVAKRALEAGHHPFGAVLVGPDHETVLSEQGNIDTVNHAEAVLARMAAKAWTDDELWTCTLYTTVEPCCMCAGTLYWANIGRLVYGMSESRLLQFTGSHPDNATCGRDGRQTAYAGPARCASSREGVGRVMWLTPIRVLWTVWAHDVCADDGTA